MCEQFYLIQLREAMDDKWKEWDVVEEVRTVKVPGFMTYPGPPRERSKELFREEWSKFVELLDEGDGYERLLTLRENMEVRKREFSKKVDKWEDRENWLRRLKGKYKSKLEQLSGAVPTALPRSFGVTDPVEKLDSAVSHIADQPIVEAFLEFNQEGRLEEWPNLEDGWLLHTGDILQGPDTDTSNLLSTFGEKPQDVDARRGNTTIRFRFSDEELERQGIDLGNLDSPRSAIRMEPSTTWREALVQIEERKASVREDKRFPDRTVRVLDFRLRILENILHRFEAFGTVGTLPEEEALEAIQEPAHVTDPPDDLFEGSGTKDRKKAKRYARELAELYAEGTEIEDEWTNLHSEIDDSELDGGTSGRNKVGRVRDAFRDHSQIEDGNEPDSPESLMKACYYFFSDVTVN